MNIRTGKSVGPVASLALAVSLAALVNGCVSRSKAREDASRAYIAGQQDALRRVQQEAYGAHIEFIGQVDKPVISWSEGLTLARAIVSAGYYAPAIPRSIVIHRNGQTMEIDPKRLVNGEDFDVEPGDVIHLQQ